MLLAIDVGNSNIVWSVWRGEQWVEPLRFETPRAADRAQYQSKLEQWLQKQGVDPSEIDASIVSSVVPAVTAPLRKAITHLLGFAPIILDSQIDTGITLGADHPERVGADLIADAVGGYNLINDSCIVVDFGTATTVMTVERPGILNGVAICAGLKVSVEALVGRAAQLESIPLEIPASPRGKNTVQAMQSGLVLGHLCMVEGLIDCMREEIGPAKVVATGGFVSLLAPHTTHFDYVEPMLTLDGLRTIAGRQGGKR